MVKVKVKPAEANVNGKDKITQKKKTFLTLTQQLQQYQETPKKLDAQQVQIETFDDFLNTLSDDDEEVDEDEDGAKGSGALIAHENDSESEDEDNEEDSEGEDEEDFELEDEVSGEEEDDDDELGSEEELGLDSDGNEDDDEDGTEEETEELLPEPHPNDYFERDEEPNDINIQDTATTFKKSLASLQETDPDFFEYLKENDADLLNFDATDDDEEEGNDSDEQSDEGDDEDVNGLHRPSTELEVASDSEAESEEEQNADKNSAEYKKKLANSLRKRIVNLSVISYWQDQLNSTRDLTIFSQVVEAFESAVETILQDKDQSNNNKSTVKNKSAESATSTKWKIVGSHNFNALIRLCIRSIFIWCTKYLSGSNNQEFCVKAFTKSPYEVKEKNSSRWTKLRPKLRIYMTSLVVYLKSMGNPEAITSILRHCQLMSGFWSLFATKSYKLLRTLINIWSTGEDTNRVVAFITILRMSNYNKEVYLTRVFKHMYIAFVSNCKFTSANSWPSIHFMRASLVEIYLLDTNLAYKIAFPFIRQLAIHLRNATTAGNNTPNGKSSNNKNKSGSGGSGNGSGSKKSTASDGSQVFGKKEASKIVYSWQFLHSLHLWVNLLSEAISKGDENLQLLVHPVVQVCLGTIKLIPTKKFIPLRFHIIKMLIELQDKTKLFIPILPLITEVLNLTDFSHKTAGKFSVRPLNLQCCLKADPNETGYFKAVADGIYETILGTCKVIATEIAFPEIVTPTLIQLKGFLKKKCKNGEVARKFKTLVEKIEANSNFVKEKRNKAMETGQISLSDEKSQQILRLEIENSNSPSPILIFAKDYFKMTNKLNEKIHLKKIGKDNKDDDFTRAEKFVLKQTDKKELQDKKPKKKLQAMEGNLLFGENEDDEEFSGTKLDDDDDEVPIAVPLQGQGQGTENQKQGKKRKQKPELQEEEDASASVEEGENELPRKKQKKQNSKNESKTKKSKARKAEVTDLQDEIVDLNFDDDDEEEKEDDNGNEEEEEDSENDDEDIDMGEEEDDDDDDEEDNSESE